MDSSQPAGLTLRTFPLQPAVTGRAIFCEHPRRFDGDDEPCHRFALYRDRDHTQELQALLEVEGADQHHHCKTLNAIGMNPSAARADEDDQTVRMLWLLARRHGYCKLVVTNAFAYRATLPLDMLAAARAGMDLLGGKNDARVLHEASWADCVLACWGSIAPERDKALRRLLRPVVRKLYCLGLTKAGQPRHPRGVASRTEWQRLTLPEAQAKTDAAIY